jgi:hypothetical protein
MAREKANLGARGKAERKDIKRADVSVMRRSVATLQNNIAELIS